MSGEPGALPAAARGSSPADPDLQSVVEALGDRDCRGLLRTVGDDAMTASECSVAYDLPLSTTYRKLDRLTDAGLFAEELRIRRDGKHTNEYRRDFESVCLTLAEDGSLDLSVTPADPARV